MKPSARYRLCRMARVLALASVLVGPAWAAGPTPAPSPASAPASAAPDEGWIQLNLPPVIDLKLLIDYVSKRMGINIIYDEGIGATRVAILAPAKIRKDELVGLLQNALKMAGLNLVDSAQPNWKTIGRKALVRFVDVKNVAATDLAKRVSGVLGEQERIAGSAGRLTARVVPARVGAAATGGAIAAAGGDVTLVPDAKANQIAVVATEPEMTEALALIESLDVSPKLETRAYHFRHISPKRIDAMVRSRVETDMPDAGYSAVVDEATGLLMVTGRSAVHKFVELLSKELDVENDPNRSNIQFYKLMNTSAAEVLQTIRALQGSGSPAPAARAEERNPALPGLTGGVPGPNIPSAPGLTALPQPPGYHGPPTSQPSGNGEAPSSAATALAQSAVVTADQNTNSIIVIAPPDVQTVYRQLIAALDKRRPQVLVEVMLATLDTSNSFSLGVELGKASFGENTVVVFNSFGLSTVDPATGKPTLKPAQGFNGILISPDSLNVVVQALATNARANILAAPKILMNDNATGSLASVAAAPFSSVNASQTVSTTSFAGYATAGTTVTVTPHISEADCLQLKYSVILSSFTGAQTDTSIPPPQQSDTISSEVTVPNGYAVVVGGLTRKDFSTTVSKVPFLGDIPILKYLVSKQDDKDSKSTLFVFIRPIILRDDKFETLKYLSDHDLATAQLPPNYPVSEPVMMH
jgi:general secretion pathway protein D